MNERVPIDAGVVNQDVEPAELAHHSCDRGGRLLARRHVDLDWLGDPASLTDLLDNQLGGLQEFSAWRGPMLTKLLTQFMYDVNWGDLDYLVMDMPPGTGDIQLTTAQSVPLTGAVMVSTPQDVALMDAGKALMMFKKLNVPVLGIVENMSTFVCPHCAQPTDLFGHGGAQAAAARYGVPFLGEIPLHLRIREGGDSGRPIVVDAPGTAEAEAFMLVARNLAAQVSVIAYQQEDSKRGAPVAFFTKK